MREYDSNGYKIIREKTPDEEPVIGKRITNLNLNI